MSCFAFFKNQSLSQGQHRKLTGFLNDHGWFALLFLVIAICTFAEINQAPLGYDSSYNLQVPSNIVKGYGYSTFIGTNKEFNYDITTGFPVLLFIAAMFKAFGIGVIQFRIITISFYLGLLIVTYLIAREIVSKGLALFPPALHFLFSRLRYPHENPYDAIGEIPACFLLLMGIYLIHCSLRKGVSTPKFLSCSFLAALLIGLAAMSKTLFLLVIPVGALFCFYVVFLRKDLRGVFPFLLTVLVIWGMNFSWKAYQKHVLGSERYEAYQEKAEQYFRKAGSGLTEDGFVVSTSLLWSKVSNFTRGMGMRLRWLVMLASLLGAALLLRLYKDRITYAELFIAGFIGMLLLWWFFVSNKDFFRHALPAVLLSFPLLASVLACLEALLGERRSLALDYSIPLISLIILTASLLIDTMPERNNLASQRTFSEQVSRLERPIVYIGWWQNPEVAFLQQGVFQRLDQYVDSGNTQEPILIFSPLEKRVNWEGYLDRRTLCKETLVIVDDYEACSVDMSKADLLLKP